jgi:hypothetical protein
MEEWRYSPPPSPIPSAVRQLRPAYPPYEPTAEQYGALIDHIQREEPELLQALDALAAENALRARKNERRLATMWVGFRLDRYVRTIMPSLGGVDRSDFVHAVINKANAAHR